MTDSFTALEIEATNHHPFTQSLQLLYGGVSVREEFRPGERKTVRIDAKNKAQRLVFRSRTLIPAKDYGRKRTADTRALGVFVHDARYISPFSRF